MSKKIGIGTSLLLGIAGGAAAAVFLATETGQAVKKKAVELIDDYKENHEEINAELIRKAQGLGDQAVSKFTEVKEQLESGELTMDDLIQSGKEKAQALKKQSLEKFEEFKEAMAEQAPVTDESVELVSLPEAEEKVVQEDIEIDL